MPSSLLSLPFTKIRKHAKRLLLCSLLLTSGWAMGEDIPQRSGAIPATPAPITKGQRIYAAHHSYFLPIPPIMTEIAKSAGFEDQVFVGTKYIGGSKSIQHWNIKDEDNKAKDALNAGNTDVLILTPVYLPDEGIEKFARLGFEHNPNIRVTVMEFWLPYDEYQPHYYDAPTIPKPQHVDHNAQTGASLRAIHERYFQEMDALIRDVNGKLGKQVLFVVPMGQAVIALREKIIAGEAPGLKSQEDIFTDSLGHPKPALQALIAYAHYAVIYRKNPAGLPVPKVLANLHLPDNEAEGLNHLLQQIAWDTVTHHPLSGVGRLTATGQAKIGGGSVSDVAIRVRPRNSGNPPPVYPDEARRLGQQGQVLVHVKVGTDGTAQDVSVKQSSGFPLLDEAALAAVRHWKFDSTGTSGIAPGSDVDVPLRFTTK